MASIFWVALWMGLSVPFSTLSPERCGVVWATDFIRLAYLGNRVHFEWLSFWTIGFQGRR